MEFEIKKLPKSEVELTVTVPAADLEKYHTKAAEELSRDVKVKGFRPGKVPPHILEEYVKPEFIEARAQELAIQKSYTEVVIKEKIQVVARPRVEIKKPAIETTGPQPLKYVAVVATLPEVELKDHKSVKVPKEKVEVTDKEINEVMDELKARVTEYKEVDRKSKKGDRVEIDFTGLDEKGNPLEGTTSKNHPIVIGSNTMIPGFEDSLVGLKKGEEKDFKITFPKDYHKKDFQNKKTTFKTKMLKVEEAVEPEMNEEFVEKITGTKKPIADLKKEIEDNLKAKKEKEAKVKRENKYIEELLKKAKVELPDSLIAEESNYILQDMKEDIQMRGADWQNFLDRSKTKEEDLIDKYKPEAERRLKIRLVLQEVIKKEEIKIEESDLKKELDKMKSSYPEEEQKKIDAEFESGKLKSRLANQLALEKLFSIVLPD